MIIFLNWTLVLTKLVDQSCFYDLFLPANEPKDKKHPPRTRKQFELIRPVPHRLGQWFPCQLQKAIAIVFPGKGLDKYLSINSSDNHPLNQTCLKKITFCEDVICLCWGLFIRLYLELLALWFTIQCVFLLSPDK